MIHIIKAVKREMRVLGIDTCRPREILGAIVRGGSFLDGVVRFNLGTSRPEQRLANDVLATRYYPELRALMIHDPENLLARTQFEGLVGLPVIKVSETLNIPRGSSVFSSDRGRVYYQSSISSPIVSQILGLTWRVGKLPEPVRIAHLLAGRAGPKLTAE